MYFENVVNAFWNVDNAFQRNEIFIENHFKIVAEHFECVLKHWQHITKNPKIHWKPFRNHYTSEEIRMRFKLWEIFTTFRLSRALKPSSKRFQFPNNGQYKAFYNVATILCAQKLAYVVPFCVVETLHVKDRTAPYLIFVTFIVTKKCMLNHLVSKFSIMQAFNIPSCYIFHAKTMRFWKEERSV